MAATPSVLLIRQPHLRLARVLQVTSAFGIAPPAAAELEEARALASRLMSHKVATMDTYFRVLAVQPAAVLVFKEGGQVTGVTGQLFLNRRAVDQLLQGEFDALDPDPSLLTTEGQRPVAAYAWGVAAATKPAGAAILGGGGAMRERLFPNLTAFTRAVTGAGRHVALTRYGYRPLRGPDDDLMVTEPQAQEQAA